MSLFSRLRSGLGNTFRYTLAIRFAILLHVAKKVKRMRAYRLPDETIFEIERLSDEWNCTHADVIERAIAAIAGSEPSPEQSRQSASGASELRVEYDE